MIEFLIGFVVSFVGVTAWWLWRDVRAGRARWIGRP